MGVRLGGLVEARRVAIDDHAGKRNAIDGHNILYQFLSIIRSRQGEPLSSVTKARAQISTPSSKTLSIQ